ncbi:MAG: type II secretion system protein N [Candidatus Omnitrophota bacterium]
MAEKNISPEKKLLNIIEGEGNESQDVNSTPASLGKKFFSIAALRGRISFLKAKALQGPVRTPRISFSFAGFNVLMQLCIVGLVIYLGMSIRVEFSRLLNRDWKEQSDKEPLIAADVKAVASLLQSESYYLNKVKARNLFGFADEPEEEKIAFKEPAKQEPTELEKMVKSLKLVGISWSNDPDAIIEDENAKKTYFVKTGHKINEISVQAIYRDKVILHYLSQEVELR